MADPSARLPEAIVICTRNRPSDLRTTLQSIAQIQGNLPRRLLVIDASRSEVRATNQTIVRQFEIDSWEHCPYDRDPSLARQRNYGMDRLPPSVEIVHFIDDDVTVRSGYFDHVSAVFREHPKVGGVGGVIVEPTKRSSQQTITERARRLFLLSHDTPGRVLQSGCTTTAQHPTAGENIYLRDTEWLSGCSSSYRRSLLDRHRFDESLTGYSMLEDLDLSYRIGNDARLVVQPQARLKHRRSEKNRYDVEQFAYALTIHRRWFIEKHFDDTTSRLAYWWSLAGRLLAVSKFGNPRHRAAFKGLIRGIHTVWTRDHPLL